MKNTIVSYVAASFSVWVFSNKVVSQLYALSTEWKKSRENEKKMGGRVKQWEKKSVRLSALGEKKDG